MQLLRSIPILLLAPLWGCAAQMAEGDPFDMNKADMSRYDNHQVIPDRCFTDTDAVDAAGVQTILEQRRSFLARESVDGERFADALVRTARAHDLNPLILLSLAQTQKGLITKKARPSDKSLRKALGCFARGYDGLGRQLECAALTLKKAYDAAARLEPSVGRIDLGNELTTQDARYKVGSSQTVQPANRATVALYNYGPTVYFTRLYYAVYGKLCDMADYDGFDFPYNEGFIGGECQRDSDCLIEGGKCEFPSGHAVGTCTAECSGELACPDRAGARFSPTFCTGAGEGIGRCRARCEEAPHGALEGGCRGGFTCAGDTPGHSGSGTASTCAPEDTELPEPLDPGGTIPEPLDGAPEILVDDAQLRGVDYRASEWSSEAVEGAWLGRAHFAAGQSTFLWTPTLAEDGIYDVFVRIPPGQYAERAIYTVGHLNPARDDVASHVPLDQSSERGEWKRLHAFPMRAGVTSYVLLTSASGVTTVADAVGFHRVGDLPERPAATAETLSEPEPAPEVVLDDTSESTGYFEDEWETVTDAAAHGGSAHVSTVDGATFSWLVRPEAGTFDVFARWVSVETSGMAEYRIHHLTPRGWATSSIDVDQSERSGQWVWLGSYEFPAPDAERHGMVQITSDWGTLVADAVRLSPAR